MLYVSCISQLLRNPNQTQNLKLYMSMKKYCNDDFHVQINVHGIGIGHLMDLDSAS